MGIISAGKTTIGIIEFPSSGGHNHSAHNNSMLNSHAFLTKEEAEKRAEKLGCSGIHKMGDFWIPCESH